MATPVVISRIQNRRGLQDQFNELYPPGYNGVGGYGSIPGFDAATYPDVLFPGEIAFCTDSRRAFIGNVNGEYVEIAHSSTTGSLILEPITVSLPATATFTAIAGLDYMPPTATPFVTIFYDLTDDVSVDWNTPGTNFSRNGTLQVTAIKTAGIPPTATLTDTGSELNNSVSTISFIAEYDPGGAFIQIKYKHNFPGPLTFNSRSLDWQPF